MNSPNLPTGWHIVWGLVFPVDQDLKNHMRWQNMVTRVTDNRLPSGLLYFSFLLKLVLTQPAFLKHSRWLAAAKTRHLQTNNLRHVTWYRPDVKETVAPKNNLIQRMNSVFHFKIMTFKRCFDPKLVAFPPFIQGLTVLLYHPNLAGINSVLEVFLDSEVARQCAFENSKCPHGHTLQFLSHSF